MGKYLIVVGIVVLTALLAGVFPYAQNNNVNERPLVVALDTFYSVDLDSDEAAVCYLGDFAFFIRTANQVILIDPSDEISSRDIYAIRKLDILLISGKEGNYYETTQSIYQRTNSTVITNREVYNELEDSIPAGKLRAMSSGERLSISDTTVTALSSNPNSNEPLMFIISIYGRSLFYGSDTNYDEEFSDLLAVLSNDARNIDVAFVPTEGVLTEPNSRYAVDMVKTLGAEVVITMHGSAGEQNGLKNLLDKEIPNVSVLVPERLWVYEIVVT